MIQFENIGKTYRVAKREPGVKAALRALVRREYTYIEALKNVSFSIDRGEIIGYIGPNGAGKSTTIKILSGILVPTEGRCTVFGRTPWENRIDHVRNIGVVFGQRSQLMWDIPVMDSFELLRDIYRVPAALFKRNLDEIVEIVGLADFVRTPVRQLSLGQRMRCEIVASLLHSPEILFLDEPTIGLDAVSKVAVRQFIKRINRENGVTVVLTTHDMGDIDALTDRVMLIGKGQILYDGSFEQMKGKYDPARVVMFANMVVGGTLIFTGVYILQAAAAFWTIEGLEVANILTNGMRDHASYPLNIFPRGITFVFTFVIPFGTVNYLPLQYLLGRIEGVGWLYAFLPLAGGLFILPCPAAWRVGVRRYTSAGS